MMATIGNFCIFLMISGGIVYMIYLVASLERVSTRMVPPIMSSISRRSTKMTTTTISASEALFAKDEPRLVSPLDYDKNVSDSRFRRVVNRTEAMHYVDLLRKVTEHLTKAGVINFIHSGTLLGSYRHFGFIPWDDDVDVMAPFKDRERVLKALTIPGYACVTSQGARWKFTDKSDAHIRDGIPYGWPFIDILFYKENNDTIWNSDTGNFGDERYKKNWTFPLTKRPFEGYWFYAPKDTEKFYQHINISMCVTGNWNHRHEHGISRRYTIRCDDLRPYYAFVNRTKLANGRIKETLTFGSRVIQEVVL